MQEPEVAAAQSLTQCALSVQFCVSLKTTWITYIILGCDGTADNKGIGNFAQTVPDSSWQIEPEDIDICKKPDGSDWQLGSGGFGKVQRIPTVAPYLAQQAILA